MSKKLTSTPPAVENMKRTNYFMPVPLRTGLEQIVERKGGHAADHVRKAVEQYLRRNRIDVRL